MSKRLRDSAPSRGVQEVGPGDYVKIGSHWEKIAANTAHNAPQLPRHWTVRTEDGRAYDMMGINRYAKAEDLE